jgi:hypothetical protein
MFNTGKGTNHAFLGMRENKQVRRSYITIQQQLFQGKTIIVTRHPIEMMLTNWVSWKNYFTGGNIGASFSQVYSNVEDFYEDLDRNLDCFFRFYDEGILPFSTRTHEFLEQIKANKGHWNTHGDTRLDGKPKYGLNFSQTLGETAAWKSMENTIVVQFEEF